MKAEFRPFPKMARLTRRMLITEKIDGTNASIHITPHFTYDDTNIVAVQPINGVEHAIYAGSRTRWITPTNDNFGFSEWVRVNSGLLVGLGTGTHFGEWWGKGIQRNYGMNERRFSLFNVSRWVEFGQERGIKSSAWDPATKTFVDTPQEHAPSCCHVVPLLYAGPFCTERVEQSLNLLKSEGSVAAPSFRNPEGVVVFHEAGNVGFKKTLDNDAAKGENGPR